MLAPVMTPYLPNGQAKVLLAGEGARSFSDDLHALGLEILYTKPIADLPKVLCEHADLAVCTMCNKRYLLDASQEELFTQLQKRGLIPICGETRVQSGYPDDVIYNCLKIGEKYLLCNKKTAENQILSCAKQENCVILNCKQGYTKCSVALVSENAAITDDKSIAKILSAENFDVLLIQKGDILLHGLDYGFIGGCCTMLSKSEMLFLGDIRLHQDGDTICSFLKNHGVIPICIENTPLTDIGSLVPLLQEVNGDA